MVFRMQQINSPLSLALPAPHKKPLDVGLKAASIERSSLQPSDTSFYQKPNSVRKSRGLMITGIAEPLREVLGVAAHKEVGLGGFGAFQ